MYDYSEYEKRQAAMSAAVSLINGGHIGKVAVIDLMEELYNFLNGDPLVDLAPE